MLNLDIKLVWLLASITVACLSFLGLRRYINKKMSNPHKIITPSNNENPLFNVNSNPNNPFNPSAFPQSIGHVPVGYTVYHNVNLEKILEQIVTKNLLNTKTSITLELPQDTEITLFGKKWKVKAGSRIRISSPKPKLQPEPKIKPLGSFFPAKERREPR